MAKFYSIHDLVKKGRSFINPGWTAKVSDDPPHVPGLVLHRCPRCKVALGATDGAELFVKKCHNCGLWVTLEKC